MTSERRQPDGDGDSTAPVVGAMLLWTRRLIDSLKDGKVGDEFTGEELTKLCGRECTDSNSPGWRYLQSAIKHLERSYGLCWQWVRGEGKVRCLNCREALDRVAAKRRSIGRQSRRSLRQLDTYETNGMSEAEKSELLRVGAQLGTIAMFSSDKATKKLEDKGVTKPLDLGRLLENLSKT